jgi:hypothetical protein
MNAKYGINRTAKKGASGNNKSTINKSGACAKVGNSTRKQPMIVTARAMVSNLTNKAKKYVTPSEIGEILKATGLLRKQLEPELRKNKQHYTQYLSPEEALTLRLKHELNIWGNLDNTSLHRLARAHRVSPIAAKELYLNLRKLNNSSVKK